MDLDLLRKQRVITRDEIAALLKSMGASGENRDAKLEAVESLGKQNRQGHSITLTLESYGEF